MQGAGPDPSRRSGSRSRSRPRPRAEFRLTRSVAVLWTLVSVAGFFGFAYLFGSALASIRGESLAPIVVSTGSVPDVLTLIVVAVALVVVVVVPHELLHGVFMAQYGGDPAYGVDVAHFVLPYAYAATEGRRYARNRMLVVLLAPFVTVTLAGFVAFAVYPSMWFAVPLAANAAGSIGDFWMAAALLRYPADVRVGALPDGAGGFGLYGPVDDGSDRLRRSTALSTFVVGTVGTFAVLTLSLLGAVLASLAFGSGTVVVGDPDGSWFLFGHEFDPRAGRVVLEVGTRTVVAASTAGGLAWTLMLLAVGRRRLA